MFTKMKMHWLGFQLGFSEFKSCTFPLKIIKQTTTTTTKYYTAK